MTTTVYKGKNLRNMTCVEKVKFYVSLCLGTTAVLSVFAFLFLIPFIVDPSIKTIMANFDDVPVACTTVAHVYVEGISNCTWTSCKEGCTIAPPRCHQIYVNYSRIPYDQWLFSSSNTKEIEWVAGPVKFFVNMAGCGYPPRVNCTEFARLYSNERSNGNKIFPCYYSKRYALDRTVANFDWNDTVKNLMLAVGIPNILFVSSVVVLSYWYCWPNAYERHKRVLSTTYAAFDSEEEEDVNVDVDLMRRERNRLRMYVTSYD